MKQVVREVLLSRQFWDPAARFCLGVQWHAEVLTHRSEHAPLFATLIAAAARGAAPALALAA